MYPQQSQGRILYSIMVGLGTSRYNVPAERNLCAVQFRATYEKPPAGATLNGEERTPSRVERYIELFWVCGVRHVARYNTVGREVGFLVVYSLVLSLVSTLLHLLVLWYQVPLVHTFAR